MNIELVSTKTKDGVTLHGGFLEAPTLRTGLAVDCIVFIHGSGGNFYGSPSLRKAAMFRDEGIPVVLFNTRGHDIIAGHSGDVEVGNAFDILDHCRWDIEAMVDWMSGRGYKRIGLMGTSMGAVKVIYAQAHNQDSRISAVISLSPLRLSNEYFLASELGEEHRRNCEEARALVAAGKEGQVMKVSFPIDHYFTAKAYLDRHGDERYNLARAFTEKVPGPLLILAGAVESHPRVRGAAQEIFERAKANPQAELFLIEDGDHGLRGQEQELKDGVMNWLQKIAVAPATA
ncbi:MAG: alpha/beta fold hydrolase [Dehalococcoidia bacterium]